MVWPYQSLIQLLLLGHSCCCCSSASSRWWALLLLHASLASSSLHHLPYVRSECYQLDGLAAFLSDYFLYETLEPADRCPPCLPSIDCLFHWRRGDCFDLSLCLVSCLLGAGYDAYCVVGTAPKAITHNDQVNRNVFAYSQDTLLQVQSITSAFPHPPIRKSISHRFSFRVCKQSNDECPFLRTRDGAQEQPAGAAGGVPPQDYTAHVCKPSSMAERGGALTEASLELSSSGGLGRWPPSHNNKRIGILVEDLGFRV